MLACVITYFALPWLNKVIRAGFVIQYAAATKIIIPLLITPICCRDYFRNIPGLIHVIFPAGKNIERSF